MQGCRAMAFSCSISACPSPFCSSSLSPFSWGESWGPKRGSDSANQWPRWERKPQYHRGNANIAPLPWKSRALCSTTLPHAGRKFFLVPVDFLIASCDKTDLPFINQRSWENGAAGKAFILTLLIRKKPQLVWKLLLLFLQMHWQEHLKVGL